MLLNDTYEMNITGQIAYASMMINASHADLQGCAKFSSCRYITCLSSPALASDGSELLLYRPRFTTPGTFLSIVRFEEFRFA